MQKRKEQTTVSAQTTGISLTFLPPFFSYSPTGSTWLMHGVENSSLPGLRATSQNILWSTTKVNEACAWLGGPLINYLPSAPFLSIFGPTAVPKILVFRALALGARSPIYDKLGINNPSSKLSPLHILLHAILVPEQRCFVSPTGRPR